MSDKPDLERSMLSVLREALAIPFFFFAAIIQGPTALVIDRHGELQFKPTKIVEEPEYGAVIDGEFVPADGPGSILRCYRVPFVIHVEDIESLLNPATTNIDGDHVASGDMGPSMHTVVIGDVSRNRARLALPFWMGALLVQGTTCIHIDDNRRLQFKSAREEKEPEPGMVVDKEFKKATGAGVLFDRFGTTIAFSKEHMEGLWNPATSEILRAVEEAEAEGQLIGDGGYSGVFVRPSTVVNVGRLSDYQPFAMLDGTSSRKQMDTAYAAATDDDGTGLGRIMAIIMAFALGAMSPRLNGLSGGGGGGGGEFSAPTSMPGMIDPGVLVSPEIATAAMDIASAGVI